MMLVICPFSVLFLSFFLSSQATDTLQTMNRNSFLTLTLTLTLTQTLTKPGHRFDPSMHAHPFPPCLLLTPTPNHELTPLANILITLRLQLHLRATQWFININIKSNRVFFSHWKKRTGCLLKLRCRGPSPPMHNLHSSARFPPSFSLSKYSQQQPTNKPPTRHFINIYYYH